MTRAPRPARIGLAAAALALLGIPGASAALEGITPPTAHLTGTLGDHGWWRGKVTVTWVVDTGNGFVSSNCSPTTVAPDVTGKVVECSATYENSDGGRTTITQGTPPISIDTTPPTVERANPRRPPDRYGWYSHRIRVTFSGKDSRSGIASCTHPLYHGPTSASATLTGHCKDRAGNIAAGAYELKYASPFLMPRKHTRVARPPVLDWPAVSKARLYNVQLWHTGKVLSKWPTRSKLRLRHAWRFDGQRIRLTPGRYDWYVWPRIGDRYHHLVGHGVFYKRAY